jgi:hypothetical protein
VGVQINRLKWADKSMEWGMRIADRNLIVSHLEKRPLETPRSWEDNIKKDFKEWVEDWK